MISIHPKAGSTRVSNIANLQCARIQFLTMMLIKLEAAKQWSKKRKEMPDDKEDASKDSSPAPQAKKTKVADTTKKNSSTNGVKIKKGSLFGDGTTSPKNLSNNTEESRPEEKTQEEDDSVEDTIVVAEHNERQPVRKATGPTHDTPKALKTATGASTPPFPVSKSERKLAAKPLMKGIPDLKVGVVPGQPQGPKCTPKPSDSVPRTKGHAKATPPAKSTNGRSIAGPTSGGSLPKAKKSSEPNKTPTAQGQTVKNQPKVLNQKDKEKTKSTLSKESTDTTNRQRETEKRRPSMHSDDSISVCKPTEDAVIQNTVEEENVHIKQNLLDDAASALNFFNQFTSPPATGGHDVHEGLFVNENDPIIGQASQSQSHDPKTSIQQHLGIGDLTTIDGREVVSDNGGPDHIMAGFRDVDLDLMQGNDAVGGDFNGDQAAGVMSRTVTPGIHGNQFPSYPIRMDFASPLTPTPSAANNHDNASTSNLFPQTAQTHVFMITVWQPEDISKVIESICLTFAPTTTTWSSFYGSLGLALAMEDRAAFVRSTKCKVKLPRQGDEKPRLFSFGIMPPAADSIWAKIMGMVAGLGKESEAVEVIFFP